MQSKIIYCREQCYFKSSLYAVHRIIKFHIRKEVIEGFHTSLVNHFSFSENGLIIAVHFLLAPLPDFLKKQNKASIHVCLRAT